MLTILLAIIGSTIGLGLGGFLLVGLLVCAVLLKWRVEIIAIVAAIAAGYLATGFVYRAGVAACEARVERAVASEKDRQANVNALVQEAARIRADKAEKLRAEADQEIADYEAELAKRPADSSCALDGDDVKRLQQLLR